MNKSIGKVVEVFLPNNNVESPQIGFKVMLSDQMVEMIVEQNNNNSKIFKDDLVIITEYNLSRKRFINIELFDGEEYE